MTDVKSLSHPRRDVDDPVVAMAHFSAVELVPAEEFEALLARVDAELYECEARWLDAKARAEAIERQARAEGADLHQSVWTMVRFREFLQRLRDQHEVEAAELVSAARRVPRAELRGAVQMALQTPPTAVAALTWSPPPVESAQPVHVALEEPTPIDTPMAYSSTVGPVFDGTFAPAAFAPVADIEPVDAQADDQLEDEADDLWVAREDFWADQSDEQLGRRRRRASVTALLRIGAVACVAGALVLKFA